MSTFRQQLTEYIFTSRLRITHTYNQMVINHIFDKIKLKKCTDINFGKRARRKL